MGESGGRDEGSQVEEMRESGGRDGGVRWKR